MQPKLRAGRLPRPISEAGAGEDMRQLGARRQLQPAADTSESRNGGCKIDHPCYPPAHPPSLPSHPLITSNSPTACGPPPAIMSLVNLSHVCSHLQNASMARLGLTSIPYTRLHLSLSLLLHKQGFLSQVKLGGPSPPASCLPPGALREQIKLTDDTISQHEVSAKDLWKSKAQLEKDGWDSVVANFLMQHEGKASDDLRAEGLSEEEMQIAEAHSSMLAEARAEVQKWMLKQEQERQEREREREKNKDGDNYEDQEPPLSPRAWLALENTRVKSTLLRTGFDYAALRQFAGNENSQRTYRDLDRDGISVSAMGLEIENQPWDRRPHHGPDMLDKEGVVTQSNRASRRLWLGMKYWDGLPVLKKARMLSKPTKRIWLNAHELGGLTRGKGAFKQQIKPLTQVGEIMAISTDKGIMEVRECAERRIGGMVLCRIW